MSLVLCFSWPVTVQGVIVFPVAGTHLQKSTHEKQLEQIRGMAVVQMCRVLVWLSIHVEK